MSFQNSKQVKNVPTQVHVSWEDVLTLSPLGTTISVSLMVGSMYCSKAGFTNLLYCLVTPSMSRRRSVMSLRSRRTSRMSESASTKIFISRSCRWRESRAALACFVIQEVFKKKIKKGENMSPYLKKLLVCKRQNAFKYDYTGTIHILLRGESVQRRKQH